MSRRPGKWPLLAAMFGVLVLSDQVTKFLAVERLTRVFEARGDVTLLEKVRGFYGHRHLAMHATPPHDVFESWWAMRYVENPGAAFGLFQDASEGVRNAFFIAVSLVAVTFILVYYRKLREGQRYPQVALGLLLSGAVGNFIDRLARGYVVDFIDWHVNRHYTWPTFNVADSLIVVGVLMLVLHPGPKKEKVAAGEARAAGEG